jgi:hypothetical protein
MTHAHPRWRCRILQFWLMSTIMKTVNDNLLNLHFDINICISVVYVIISLL